MKVWWPTSSTLITSSLIANPYYPSSIMLGMQSTTVLIQYYVIISCSYYTSSLLLVPSYHTSSIVPVLTTPVPPLPTLKDTHHRSEFHGERVCFFKVGMSAILKKRVLFGLNIRIFCQRGSIFSILNRPLLIL